MSLLIMTPCYGGKADTPNMKSGILLEAALTELGVEHDWLLGTNESLVQRARCEMIWQFMTASDYAAGMWIDADIQYTAQQVADLWNVLAVGTPQERDVVSGIYPMKKPYSDWYAAWKDGELIKGPALEKITEPTPIDLAGTGFMMFTRTALEKLMVHLKRKSDIALAIRKQFIELYEAKHCDTLPKLQYDVLREMTDAMEPYYEKQTGEIVPAMFKCPIHNGGLESEDYHFCRNIREAGMELTLVPSARVVHWGQWAYGLYEHLKEGDEHL